MYIPENNLLNIESKKETHTSINELIEMNKKLLKINEELNERNEELTKDLDNQKRDLKNLGKKFEAYKTGNDKVIDSYHSQLKTLFLYYELKPKGLLKQNHILTQELLDFIVNICKKYDLEYWLDFGLLLGAIRHGGFIPWDDDGDIGMIRKDYNVLLDVIEDEIKEHGLENDIVISLNLHKYKIFPILQILYNGGMHKTGIILGGLDIFPYDYISNTDNCNAKSYNEIRKLVCDANREGTPINEAMNVYYEKFDINLEKEDHIIPGVEGPFTIFKGYNFSIWNTDEIFPLKPHRFENKYYTCPNNQDSHLRHIYGEYHQIPKIIQHHHHRFEKLLKMGDATKIYNENIEKLKAVNRTFK